MTAARSFLPEREGLVVDLRQMMRVLGGGVGDLEERETGVWIREERE